MISEEHEALAKRASKGVLSSIHIAIHLNIVIKWMHDPQDLRGGNSIRHLLTLNVQINIGK